MAAVRISYLAILLQLKVSSIEASYQASSTRYYPGDTAGTSATQEGACGDSLADVYSTLSGLGEVGGYYWFPVSPSESMVGPFTCEGGCPSVTPDSDADCSDVLHVYCGQCVEFTTTDGKKAGGLVMDYCSSAGNFEWCGAYYEGYTTPSWCAANSHGYYNHLDFYGASVNGTIGDNPKGTVVLVDCPSEVTSAITTLADASSSETSPVCQFWKDDDTNWMGCPGMDVYGCTVCENHWDSLSATLDNSTKREGKGNSAKSEGKGKPCGKGKGQGPTLLL